MVYRNGYITIEEIAKHEFKMKYTRQLQSFQKTIKGHDLNTAVMLFKKEINNQGY